jgi:hypothetical protein
MAFPSAGGYGNLPNGVFTPVIYSKRVLLSLKKTAVVDEVTNTEFQGEISNMGDTVRIIKQPVMTVQSYTRGQILQSQDIIDEDITLVINQAFTCQFYLDDIEVRQSHIDYMNLTADAAAYAIRDKYDSGVLTDMVSGVASANIYGTTSTELNIGFGGADDYTPLDILSHLCTALDVANVPDDGKRFLVAAPSFYESLRREDSKLIEAQVIGTGESSIVVNENLWSKYRVHGFRLYKSNNTPTNATSGNNVLLAGHTMATATAASILKNEIVRSPSSFGDINRTLFVYGDKVLRGTAMALAYINIVDI